MRRRPGMSRSPRQTRRIVRDCERFDTVRPPEGLRDRDRMLILLRLVPDRGPELLALAERLSALSDERALQRPSGTGAGRRAERLRDHLAGHVLPRARSLDDPLLVLLVGPTGAGKSSLLNALARRRVSPSGCSGRRPATWWSWSARRSTPGSRARISLADLAGSRLSAVVDPWSPPGIVLVDAPDVDSVEHANRELADRLVEAADLGVFVTTATRYADRVPWEVLARARDRGLPLVVVVNRLPADPADRASILDDVQRLLAGLGSTRSMVRARCTGGARRSSP